MMAVVCSGYGTSDVLEIQDVEKPIVRDDEALVRVKTVALNVLDLLWRGRPYAVRLATGLRKPRIRIPGRDVAGVVESVGPNVKDFRPGDEVFGLRPCACAEYVSVPHDRLMHKPARVTFDEAAAVPVAGLTALQGLRDLGTIRAGEKVLINGATGGVGTFAVQIAKSYGTEVTGVCSTGKVDLVRSLGADHIVDYTCEDFSRSGARYDVVFDNAGNRSLSDFRRVLAPGGILVLNSAGKNPSFGRIARMMGAALIGRFVRPKIAFGIAKGSKGDLEVLKEMMETGKVRPVIDRRYPLTEVRAAMRYLAEGHARGKVVITV